MSNNFFSLFDMPVAFDIDKIALKNRYLSLQKQHHPDAQHGADDSHSALINHAFNTLNRDDNRAIHLLEIHHQDINLTHSISDLEFLDAMMDIRIALDDTEQKASLSALSQEVDDLISAHSQHFHQAYEHQDWAAAKELAKKLQFLGKLQDDVLAKINDIAHHQNDDDLYV